MKCFELFLETAYKSLIQYLYLFLWWYSSYIFINDFFYIYTLWWQVLKVLICVNIQHACVALRKVVTAVSILTNYHSDIFHCSWELFIFCAYFVTISYVILVILNYHCFNLQLCFFPELTTIQSQNTLTFLSSDYLTLFGVLFSWKPVSNNYSLNFFLSKIMFL